MVANPDTTFVRFPDGFDGSGPAASSGLATAAGELLESMGGLVNYSVNLHSSWFASSCSLDAASTWETAVDVALVLGGTHQASGESIGFSVAEGGFCSFED